MRLEKVLRAQGLSSDRRVQVTLENNRVIDVQLRLDAQGVADWDEVGDSVAEAFERMTEACEEEVAELTAQAGGLGSGWYPTEAVGGSTGRARRETTTREVDEARLHRIEGEGVSAYLDDLTLVRFRFDARPAAGRRNVEKVVQDCLNKAIEYQERVFMELVTEFVAHASGPAEQPRDEASILEAFMKWGA